jgi:hypothetical protein
MRSDDPEQDTLHAYGSGPLLEQRRMAEKVVHSEAATAPPVGFTDACQDYTS